MLCSINAAWRPRVLSGQPLALAEVGSVASAPGATVFLFCSVLRDGVSGLALTGGRCGVKLFLLLEARASTRVRVMWVSPPLLICSLSHWFLSGL